MSLDAQLFLFLNGTLGWDALEPVMKFLSTFEYFLPLVVVLVLWMVLRDGRRGRFTVLALLLLVPATDQISSHVLKPWVARPRPCRSESGLLQVKTYGTRCSAKGSFPSSHATNVAGVVMLLGLRYRGWWAILGGILAFLVGYSRVYLGVHYPGDVAGGWALGVLLGLLVAALARWSEGRWRRGRGDPVDSPPGLT